MKTFSYKLYSHKRNFRLHGQIDLAGEIHNHLVSLHKRYYKQYGKHLNKYLLQKHVARLKQRDEFAHWKLLGSQAIQDIASRIDKGYKLFFANRKRGVKASPPKFKKRRRYTSFTLKQAGWGFVGDNILRIGKHCYKFVNSRPIEGRIKTITIKRNALGELFVYFACELKALAPSRAPGDQVGLDFGLKTFLSASDGQTFESPLFFQQGRAALKKANRDLSRKVKGSGHWHRARKRLARLHEHIASQRKDFHFKLARQLCQQYSHIYLETLNLKGMQRLWGRKIGDLGFSQFVSILHHIKVEFGSVVEHIDKWFPSSKLCSVCGEINKALTLSDRTWTCAGCQTVHDRDFNASVNIKLEGASPSGREDVSRCSHRVLRLIPESQVL